MNSERLAAGLMFITTILGGIGAWIWTDNVGAGLVGFVVTMIAFRATA